MTESRDFSDPRTKKKGKAYDVAYAYVDTSIDRDRVYREWHRTIGDENYCMDLDQFEYRRVNNVKTAVAFQEISRIEKRCPDRCFETHEEFNGNHPIGDGYRQNVWDRIWTDDQGEMVSMVARSMVIPAYFVLYRPDLSEFWVRMLYPDTKYPLSRWQFYTNETYQHWIRSLETNLTYLKQKGCLA